MIKLVKHAAALSSLLAFGVQAGTTITYIYADPVGTPLAEADASGIITATFDYRPYGSLALGAASAGPGYTGHVGDQDTGLIYMQARFYDPMVGRFLSTDPSAVRPGDGFTFNRYAYANSNPVANIDPDGRIVRSGSLANTAVLAQYINQLAGGHFAFKGDRLVQVSSAPSSGGSSYYADRLVTAINSDKTLTINIGKEHVGESGTTYSVNDVGGGGITELRSNGDVNSTIDGDGHFTRDVNNGLLYASPAEVLMHEIVGHALPNLGYPGTGDAVANENKARAQIGLIQRAAEPKDPEIQPHQPPPPPPAPSCGMLCAQ